MQRQRLFGVIVVVLVIVGIIALVRGGGMQEEAGVEGEDSTMIEEVVTELSSQLGVTIPEDVERISLRDVSGGDSTGLATRNYDEAGFVHTVLAALPDLQLDTFYNGWLVRGSKGEADYSLVNAGRLRRAKGGYLLEYSSKTDLTDHEEVMVTVEIMDDGAPETIVLEGSF